MDQNINYSQNCNFLDNFLGQKISKHFISLRETPHYQRLRPEGSFTWNRPMGLYAVDEIKICNRIQVLKHLLWNITANAADCLKIMLSFTTKRRRLLITKSFLCYFLIHIIVLQL